MTNQKEIYNHLRLDTGVQLVRDEGTGELKPTNIFDKIPAFTYHLKFPQFAPHAKVSVKPTNVTSAFSLYEITRRKYSPEMQEEGLFYEAVRTRVTPTLTPEEVDDLANPDYDSLKTLLMNSRYEGKNIFATKGVSSKDFMKDVYTGMGQPSRHKSFEAESGFSMNQEPLQHQAFTVYMMSRFASPKSIYSSTPHYSFEEFLAALEYADFMRIVGSYLSGRVYDWKPITDILTGPPEVGPKIPFPDTASQAEEEARQEGAAGETEPV